MNSSNRPGSFTWGNGCRDDWRGQNQRFPLWAEGVVELIWDLGSARHVAGRWALCRFSCGAHARGRLHVLFLFSHYFQLRVFFNCQLKSCFVSVASLTPLATLCLGFPWHLQSVPRTPGSRKVCLALLAPGSHRCPPGEPRVQWTLTEGLTLPFPPHGIYSKMLEAHMLHLPHVLLFPASQRQAAWE